MIGTLIIGICISYMVCNYKYRQYKQSFYLPKIDKVREAARAEKDWILRNQRVDGAIYYTDSEDVINPYFACLAVLGLYSGDCKAEDLKAADNYLAWHCRRFLAAGGVIPDYRICQGKESEKKPDSADAYIALYLLALCRKKEVTGSLGEKEKESVILGIEKLDEMTQDGLTSVREGSEVCYYMDNVEVLAAYRELGRLAEKDGEYPDFAQRMAEKYNKGLLQLQHVFWNSRLKCYSVEKEDPGMSTRKETFSVFYPYAVAQVYGYAFGLKPESYVDSEALWKMFCDTYKWEEMNMGGDAFYWTELSYIAVKQGDIERAEAYLERYLVLTAESREYPFYVGNSGWASRTCAELENYYKKEISTGLLRDFICRKTGKERYGSQDGGKYSTGSL